MNFPACAECVIESNGAGRPPAVTLIEGTALCVDHAERRLRDDLRRTVRSVVMNSHGSLLLKSGDSGNA